LHLVDGSEVEVNGGRGKRESHRIVTSGVESEGGGEPPQHHKFN
jgi:hypothetical protein